MTNSRIVIVCSFDIVSKISIQDYLQRIDDYLQKDRERGILRDDVDEKMAAYLYTTIEYLAYQYCRHHDITYREDNQVISRMMDILFFGIYGKKPEREEEQSGE